jgi:acyl-CoA reductase-like NAD-dependent aldehyde dehydrogenase
VQAIFYYSGDRQDATIKGPKTEEKNNKSEREEAIESYEPLTPEQGTTVCTNIIKIRQKQTANPFSPDFMQDLSGHTEDTIEDAVNAIDAASSRRDQALKQAQSEEQKKAIADAFEARKKALEESSGD